MPTKSFTRRYRSSCNNVPQLPGVRSAAAAPRVGEVHDRARERGLGGLVLFYGSKVCSKAAPVIIPKPNEEYCQIYLT